MWDSIPGLKPRELLPEGYFCAKVPHLFACVLESSRPEIQVYRTLILRKLQHITSHCQDETIAEQSVQITIIGGLSFYGMNAILGWPSLCYEVSPSLCPMFDMCHRDAYSVRILACLLQKRISCT